MGVRIKTILNWRAIYVSIVLCVGFFSCTDDDALIDYDFLYKEWQIVTVNGQTTKEYLGEEELTIKFLKDGQLII